MRRQFSEHHVQKTWLLKNCRDSATLGVLDLGSSIDLFFLNAFLKITFLKDLRSDRKNYNKSGKGSFQTGSILLILLEEEA